MQEDERTKGRKNESHANPLTPFFLLLLLLLLLLLALILSSYPN